MEMETSFTDRNGVHHEIDVATDNAGERVVFIDNDPYTAADARRLAASLIAAAEIVETVRCPRCCDPIDDHIDAESSCAIWARGADGEVLTVD